jgi:Protein of unknown function (DUF2793)
MPTPETARHKLPLLAVSQAQKEITHNEAIVRIDALLHAVAQDILTTPPSVSDADIGKCWLVSAVPSGGWAGKAGDLAVWIGGGWRFCTAAEGMRVRLQTSGTDYIRSEGEWVAAPAIADPVNGSVIDVETRQAIGALFQYLRSIGFIAT